MDFFLGGQAVGSVASALLQNNMDPRVLRPYLGGKDHRTAFIDMTRNGKDIASPILNSGASLRKDEWKALDDAVVMAYKPRLRFVNEIIRAGLVMTIPNGMGKTILETEKQSDMSQATISMEALRESQSDRPAYDITHLPLPIIHKDYYISARQLAASRNGGSPLDTSSAKLATRRVSEEVEKLALGTAASYAYGGGTVYGATNFTSRNTKTLTAPTVSGWTPKTLLDEILDMRYKAQSDSCFGPYMLFTSLDWDKYMDGDFSTLKGDNTLRQRLQTITDIQGVMTLDYLPAYTILLIQLTDDVIRMINAMPITTVQWESNGGMLLHFKVMCIMVPQVRADYTGQCGIVHGAPA